MYHADLSPYRYHPNAAEAARGLRNVGWLDEGHLHPQGGVDPDAVARLWEFCRVFLRAYRGYHTCNLCQGDTGLTLASRGESRLKLGYAEIRVFGADGICYAAPNLIYHYVTAHRYAPPQAFLDALRDGPQPDTAEYERLLQSIGHTVHNIHTLAARDPRLAERFALTKIAQRTASLAQVARAAQALGWDAAALAQFLREYQGPMGP